MKVYNTLVADPPWPSKDKLPWGGAGRHYELMTLQQIKDFSPGVQLAPDCRLFLWRIASMQKEALEVAEAWGFEVKSEVVWKKLTSRGNRHFGMGRQVRMEHEVCLIATRGRPERLSASVRSVFEAPVTKHSAKPDEFYRLVDELSPGPIVELFARRTWPGWTCKIS